MPIQRGISRSLGCFASTLSIFLPPPTRLWDRPPRGLSIGREIYPTNTIPSGDTGFLAPSVVFLVPVGNGALPMLAIALSVAFGLFGVLIGAAIAVRNVMRDESRYGDVRKLCEGLVSDHSQLRLEWTTTLENLEQLNTSVERGRRRSAASLSAAERREAMQQEPAPPATPREEREEARRRLRRIS